MTLSNSFYISHYFNFAHAGEYLLVVLLALAVVMTIIILAARKQKKTLEKELEEEQDERRYRSVFVTSWADTIFVRLRHLHSL